MVIHEFWTFFTDIVLSALCFFYAFKLNSNTESKADLSSRLWVQIFISIGTAALSGAIYHGFKPYLPLPIFNGMRILVLFCLSTTAYMISISLLRFSLTPEHKRYKLIKGFLGLKLIIFFMIAVLKTQFLVGVVDYGSTFIVAAAIYGAKWKHPASSILFQGVMVSLGAAAIQTLKIAPHPSFNHNDLYHVVQMYGLYLFYKGSPKLTDKVDG